MAEQEPEADEDLEDLRVGFQMRVDRVYRQLVGFRQQGSRRASRKPLAAA